MTCPATLFSYTTHPHRLTSIYIIQLYHRELRFFLYVPGNLGDIVIFAAAFNALSLQPVNVVFLADSVSTAYLLQSLIGHNPVSCLFLEFSVY